jgi:glycosyltransferase involved in cell wall biosynthesis
MYGVSFVIPVYNGWPYVQQAVQSMLHQHTVIPFEIIIINDGSTDETAAWLATLQQPTIKVLQQYPNQGLVASLNNGVQAAKYAYIARMDADDICLPNRLTVQVKTLEANPTWAGVAGLIKFINNDNSVTGTWALDRNTITPATIKKAMAWECCLAHPTMLLRREILLQFPYRAAQKNIEDYDLWLQLLAANKTIGKVPETVLHYRVHQSSVTKQTLHQQNFYFKKWRCKIYFLRQYGFPFTGNSFVWKVAVLALADGVLGVAKQLKKRL